MSNLVQLFAKAPVPGKVKTRVARETSDHFACELHKVMCERIIGRAESAADAVEIWTTGPDAEMSFFHQFDLPIYIQQGNDLGERMHRALKHGLARHQKAAIVGADAYSLSASDMRACFSALDHHSAAIIPATDGGYVALAAKSWSLAEFGAVDWGTNKALEQTLEFLKLNGVDHCLLPTRWDIDTLADIQKHAPELLSLVQ